MPFAVYILGFLIFSQTTSEFMVAGIMPSLSDEFGVSTSAIGYLISVYAAGMIIGGPLLTIGLLKMPRKKALLAITSIFLIGQALGSIASSYEVMIVARAITGVSSAACFGISMAITFHLVEAQSRGRAASVVLGGLMIATAAGLPLAMVFNQYFGWRASFWAIIILVLLAGLLAQWFIPSTIKQEQVSIRKELELFKSYPLWAAYATSMFIIGATFAAFSYFTPILTNLTGITLNIVPFILAMYGVATIIGNIIVGRLTDSYMYPTLTTGLSLLTIALVIFSLFVKIATISIMVIFIIGLVGVSLNPAMATRITRVGGTGTLVATVHTSIINLGIVIGSSIGGLTIDAGYGLASPLWVGALLAMIGLISLLPVFRGKCHALNTRRYS
ncbi:MFS transporter [Pseudogracilibacillus auburnensis]|uniref:Putative MFS family arabinose efflux permease n=1 Tax=Pseudogracilibacillus auburnensis TaxID=1494959 RepID=A0A2V3VTZ0_9BACI|nr:MFS transporter [Pseudogracilibacillus auburnensis]PXW85120.1 putative MFS family arabinose efflux permease [Pseudogracilibacillus auburnensis]